LETSSDIVHGVVVYGQILKDVFFNKEVLDVLEQSKIPKKKLALIESVDKNHAAPKDLQLISSSIRKYTDGYQNKKGRQASMGNIIKGFLTSPGYKMKDIKAMIINGYQGNQPLWKQILSIDLSDILKNVKVPYRMIQEDIDIVATTSNIRQLAEMSKNPFLAYKIVANSGHIPGMEGMKAIFDTIKWISK